MAGVTNILESVREDDFVEYFLFPPIETNDEQEQERILTAILDKANKIIHRYTKNFLWHKDEFRLVVRTSISNYLNELDGQRGKIFNNKSLSVFILYFFLENLPPHLYGVSHYGDNIEDEWFMVFILQQLTREITDSIVRVHDSDGEFLLIEAADYLPSWASPETCENRVSCHCFYVITC